MKKGIIVGALIVIVAAGAWIVVKKEENGRPQYRTEKALNNDLEASVTATGTVNPVTTVLVGTQVSGTIKDLYVDYNSLVKKGQPLAQIDPASFQAQVDQALANLMNAQASLRKSEVSLSDAKRMYRRNQELLPKQFISQSDLDASQTAMESAAAQVDTAKAQVLQAQASLRQAQTNLHYTRIISPVDGTVISRSVDVGQTVAASFQTPTLFTIAEDLMKMQVDTSVDEADIGQVAVGQTVHFNVDAYPDINFNGNVSEIRNAPITVQNVVTYDVVVKVDNRELRLKPGMTANVSIVTALRQKVLCVPNSALRFKPQSKDLPNGVDAVRASGIGPSARKGPAVWVLKDGRPKRAALAIGISDGSYTQIVGGNLKAGDDVIVEDLSVKKTSSAPPGPRMFH